jgi:hypothetical protein
MQPQCHAFLNVTQNKQFDYAFTFVPAVADVLLPAPPLNDRAFVQWLALTELTHAAAATAANSRLLLLLVHLILYTG